MTSLWFRLKRALSGAVPTVAEMRATDVPDALDESQRVRVIAVPPWLGWTFALGLVVANGLLAWGVVLQREAQRTATERASAEQHWREENHRER